MKFNPTSGRIQKAQPPTHIYGLSKELLWKGEQESIVAAGSFERYCTYRDDPYDHANYHETIPLASLVRSLS